MKQLHPHVMDLPAQVAARILARSYLEEADAARKRVLQASDDEALHDFRVAIRRLRSCTRAYRPHLEDTLKKRHRRWLRRMTQATNENRDLEVQLSWLARRRTLSEDERSGVEWLKVRLRERMWGARANALRAVRHGFPQGRADLERALSSYRGDVDPAQPRPLTCGTVAGSALAVLAARLEAELPAIHGPESMSEVHRARITGKRMRYLLEPFEYELADGRKIVRNLKRLQDALGSLNDQAVMAARLDAEMAGLRAEEPESPHLGPLAALHARVLADRDRFFERRKRRWQAREAAPMIALLRGAADELRTHRAQDDLEIERKFLLRRMPRLPSGTKTLVVDQGWLPGDHLLERVRRVRTEDGTRFYRAVKSGRGVQRQEIEEETSEQVFRALWRLTRGRRVSKRRYRVQDGELVWEIDRFTGGKLVLAEVEMPSRDTPVGAPAWLEDYIVREVTGEAKYLNVNLAS